MRSSRLFANRISLFSFFLAGFCCLSQTRGESAGRQHLHGIVSSRFAGMQQVGPLPATNTLRLAIALPLRNKAELTQLLKDLYDPSSPQYHCYLTSDQFTARFGPAAQDYQAVIEFAQANGLTVVGTHPNRMLLDVSGSVTAIEKALHGTMHLYQHPTENRQFYAMDTDPSLDLDVPVMDIRGLDNFCLPHPALKSVHLNQTNSSPYLGGSGPGGTYMGKDFRSAYVPGSPLNGAGQIAGLFELDGYYGIDITNYEKKIQYTNYVPLTNVLVDGFSGVPYDPNAVVEVSLDIEMIIAMAPGVSSLMVYEGTPPSLPGGPAAPYDLLNRMATDDLAKQISSSWVITEIVTNPVPDQIYEELGAQGQSFFQASGDEGAFFPGIFQWSDNPYTIIVGGTTLSTTSSGAWRSETTWTPYSGGGVSGPDFGNYSIPGYQQGINMSTNMGSTTMRNIPDVALTADNIYVIADDGESGAVGGTSCAAPLWAGFTALINQQCVAVGSPPVGFLNPALYAIGKSTNFTTAFHDISTGNNTNSGSPTLYYACAGYDLCTGWGTPNGTNLINLLAFPGLLVLPSTDFVIEGQSGGPFTTNSLPFTLTNAAPTPLNWSVINTSLWLSASSSNGTLAAHSTNLVTVSLNAAATNLPPGNYTATLFFTNVGTGGSQSRTFTLLTQKVAPIIGLEPQNLTLLPGSNAVFNVAAFGTQPLVYQWLKNSANLSNGGNISGARTNSLHVNNISAADAGNYWVLISNNWGSATSSIATLVIAQPPAITSQPQSQIVSVGQPATFSVTASGTALLAYQWQFGGNAIAGATNSAFAIAAAQNTNQGAYSVVVTNTFGTILSSNATLGLVDVLALGDNSQNQISLNAGAANAIAVAAGAWHNLTLQPDGTVAAWGSDDDGQCDVPPIPGGALAIAAGGYHSLAIDANTTVHGWGNDDYGQATPPPGLTNIIAIAAGTWHSVALRMDGTVVVWGDDSLGQTNVPPGLIGVVAIAAGSGHTLALLANGTVVAWGSDTDGLGDYTGQIDVPGNLTNAVAIAAGDFHSLAVRADGTVLAWGDNDNGQCSVPAGLSGVVGIAGGGAHSLALSSNGVVTAWGEDSSGQCDISTNLIAEAVSAGEAHSLLLLPGTPPSNQLLRLHWQHGQFRTLVQTLMPHHYALQFQGSLRGTNWTALPGVQGNGALRLLVDPSAPATNRFYRLQVW